MDAAAAAIELLRLVGLLDEIGSVQWEWLGDPPGNLSQGLADAKPVNLAAFFEAVTGTEATAFPADGEVLQWQRFGPGAVGLGPVWRGDDASTLLIGLGGSLTVDSSNLVVVARLIDSVNGALNPSIGQTRFEGTLPKPQFLSSAGISGTTGNGLQLGLSASSAKGTAELVIDTKELAWDGLRMATFLAVSWLLHQATEDPGSPIWTRLDRHLGPMFGASSDPPQANPIGPFPLFQEMGEPADFGAWSDSVLSTENDAQGALTFLWHLRALLTGNESGKMFDGSFHFPLDVVPVVSEGEPPVPPPAQGLLPTSGLWFALTGTAPGGDPTLALCVGVGEPGGHAEIPLLRVSGGLPTRPSISPQEMAAVASLPATVDLPSGAQVDVTPAGPARIISWEVTSDGLFGGNPGLRIDVRFEAGQPATFRVRAGALGEIATTPQAAAQLVRALALTVLDASAAGAPASAAPVVEALRDVVASASPNGAQIAALLREFVDGVAPDDLGPFTIAMAGNATTIEASVEIGPIADPSLFAGKEVRVGGLRATVDVDLLDGALQGLLSINDVRLADKATAGPGIAGSLVPDLTEVPGFGLQVDWKIGQQPQLSGGGRVPIHETLGPITVSVLDVEVTNQSLSIGVDAAFALGPVTVTAFGLGFRVDFVDGAKSISLDGLGLSMETSFLTLAGMFGAVTHGAQTDYVGAVLGVADVLELAAIGGYTEIDGEPSLFLFASLVAPLGGPPWCFVTGVAGGFGCHRALPSIDLLFEHPFLQVMDGKIPIGNGASSDLEVLSMKFAPQVGTYWIAGGVQFTSFGFIHGKVIVQIRTGANTTVEVLGSAAFGINPIAYFELVVGVSADESRLLVKAAISPNSYLIHPDIFSLSGGFALGVWYGGENAGDFLLSIGGYHPYFQVPDHYPVLDRVGVKATAFGFVHLSVECFFACTPQAIMAGASVSLWAEFAGIAAGLDVYVDVLIVWDPFFLLARMRVAVWFEFMGRQEISVELEIRTPPFGGRAVIDLALISFEVEFGELEPKKDPPRVAQFLEHQLGLTLVDPDLDHPTVAPFANGHAAGLFHVDLDGRAAAEDEVDEHASVQPGTTTSVNPEFALTVRTRLPVDAATVPTGLKNGAVVVDGDVMLALCGNTHDVGLTVTIAADHPPLPVKPEKSVAISVLADEFPASEFGALLATAQADDVGARQAVANVKSDEPVVPLYDSVEIRYDLSPEPADVTKVLFDVLQNDESDGKERFPLPLDAPADPIPERKHKVELAVSAALPGVTVQRGRPTLGRRQRALAALENRAPTPLHVLAETTALPRVVAGRLDPSAPSAMPVGVPVTLPPSSPPRRSELFDVILRTLPATPGAGRARTRPPTARPPADLLRSVLTGDAGAVGPFAADVAVAAGNATRLRLSGPRSRRSTLRVTGGDPLRVIALDAGGRPLTDRTHLVGTASALAPRAATVVLIPAPGRLPTSPGASPVALAPVGVESDTTLIALGRGSFAAHGCVLQVRNGTDRTWAPLSTLPAAMLTREARSVLFRFPVATSGWSLTITVATATPRPTASVEDIRWLARDARLGQLQTVVAADHTTFVMSVTTTTPWLLELDVNGPWRLTGVTLRPGSPESVAARLLTTTANDVIDDRLTAAGTSATTATIEVNP